MTNETKLLIKFYVYGTIAASGALMPLYHPHKNGWLGLGIGLAVLGLGLDFSATRSYLRSQGPQL